MCVRGRPVRNAEHNIERMHMLELAASEIVARSDWTPADAVLFPAGYFHLDHSLVTLAEPQQSQCIQAAPFAGACRRAAQHLDRWSPGVLLVVGIDAAPAHKRLRGDQAVAAWRADALAGHAVKAIPVAEEAAGSADRRLASQWENYVSPTRFARLASGETAVVCVCYDAFGLAATADGPCTPFRSICLLDQHSRATPVSLPLQRSLVARWQGLFAAHRPTVALIAIHGFEHPGRDGYWQRHGIATASAALGGGLAVGAAHFRYALPVGANQSPLAAHGVSDRHLHAGTLRLAHNLPTRDAFWITIGNSTKPRALVRLFEGAPLA